ncbi:hypothetical protein TSMEX_002496 [Taenia solium]|eukprot:TsM_000432200 transcript=TsM_000432200 gene=TsM_000432200
MEGIPDSNGYELRLCYCIGRFGWLVYCTLSLPKLDCTHADSDVMHEVICCYDIVC